MTSASTGDVVDGVMDRLERVVGCVALVGYPSLVAEGRIVAVVGKQIVKPLLERC